MAMSERTVRAEAASPPSAIAQPTPEFRPKAPRIYYVSPLLVGPRDRWLPLLDHIRRLGFDTLLTAPPFRTGRSESLLRPASLDRLHPALVARDDDDDAAAFLSWLAQEASGRGIVLMLDLPADLSADADLAAENPGWFDSGIPGPDEAVDPRRALRCHSAKPRYDDPALAPRIADMFARHMQQWAQAGVRGFRGLAPERVPSEAWRRLISSSHGSTTFMAWSPGLPAQEVERLAAAGFRLSFASTPWWDGRAPWLVEEFEARRLSIPAIGLVEDPGGRRISDFAAGPPEEAALRQLRSAAWLGFGYLMTQGFEFGATRPLSLGRAETAEWDALTTEPVLDLRSEITELNGFLAREPLFASPGRMQQLTADRANVTLIARADAGHPTAAEKIAVICLNPSHEHTARIDAESVRFAAGGMLGAPAPVESLWGLPI